MPSAVAGPKPPLPRRSSDRSTVPRTALLATVSLPTVDVEEAMVDDEATVVAASEVDVLGDASTVDVDVDVGETATTVTAVGGIAAGLLVPVGACEATPAEVGSGAVGCVVGAGGAAVVAGSTGGAAVVGTGAVLAGLPQSEPLNGFGGWPSMGGGG
jgi:hypothetical protein